MARPRTITADPYANEDAASDDETSAVANTPTPKYRTFVIREATVQQLPSSMQLYKNNQEEGCAKRVIRLMLWLGAI